MSNHNPLHHLRRGVVFAALVCAALAGGFFAFTTVRASVPYGWSSISSDVSPVRYGASVAQDGTVSPSQVLLFGGTASSGLLNDTWRWNGSAWTKLSPATSPPARTGASLVYDPVHNQDVLFGGSGAKGVLADTWLWNGTTWTQISPATSPPARQNASAVWDSIHNVVVIFGGAAKSGLLQDTWTWNGTTWVQASPATKPTARSGAAAAFDKVSGTMIIFGGATGSKNTPVADTWRWNGTTWAQVSMATSPSARSGAGAAFDPITNQLILFGGLGSAENNDAWAFGPTTWTKLAPAISPSARDSFGLAVSGNGSLLLVDGKSGSTAVGGTWIWQTTPGAPQNVTATGQNRQATVSWTAALSGGSPVASYTVTASPGGATMTTSTATAVMTGLQVGTAYTFTVTATNTLGTSPSSLASNPTMTWNYPTVPQNVTAVGGNAQSVVSWQAPSSNGGTGITGYTITPYIGTAAQPSTAVGGSASTATITGLNNGTTYTFIVTATNAVGAGPAATSNSVTPMTVPTAPQNVTASYGDTQSTVTWQAPASNGGSPISGYVITEFIGSTQQSTTSVGPTTISNTFTGLNDGTTYTFTVAAVNAAGTSATASASITPTNLPTVPLNESVTVGGPDNVSVSWQVPVFDGGSPISGYVVTPYIGTTALTPVSATASPVAITGLTGSTTYTFTVYATSANGTGAVATSSPVTTAMVPCPVAGATDIWTGAADGTSWSNGGNWSAGNQPNSADIVCLPNGTLGSASIVVPSSVTIGRLISYKPLTLGSGLQANSSMDFEANATWTGGTLNTSSMVIGSGAVISVSNQVTLAAAMAVTNNGTVKIAVGTYPYGLTESCSAGSAGSAGSWTNNGSIDFADPGSASINLCTTTFINNASGGINHSGGGTDTLNANNLTSMGTVMAQAGTLALNGTFTAGNIGGGAGQIDIPGNSSDGPLATFGDNVWVSGTLSGTTNLTQDATMHVGYGSNYGGGTNTVAGTINGVVNGQGTLIATGHYYSSIYSSSVAYANIAADLNVANVIFNDDVALTTKPDSTATQIGSNATVTVAGTVALSGSVVVMNNGTVNITTGYHPLNGSYGYGGISSCLGPGSPSWANAGTVIFSDSSNASLSACNGTLTNSGTISHVGGGADSLNGAPFNSTGIISSTAGALSVGSTGTFSGGTIAGGGGQIVIIGSMNDTAAATFGDNVWVPGTLSGVTTVAPSATLHVGFGSSVGGGTNTVAGTINGIVTGQGTLTATGHYYSSIYSSSVAYANIGADLNVANVVFSDDVAFISKPDGTATQIGSSASVSIAGNVTISSAVSIVNAGTVNVTTGYHALNGSYGYGGIYATPCNSGASWQNSGTIILSSAGNAGINICGGSFANSGIVSNIGAGINGVAGTTFVNTGDIVASAGTLSVGDGSGTISGGTISGSGGQVLLNGSFAATAGATFGDNVWVTGSSPQSGGSILSGVITIAANATLNVGYDPSFGVSTTIGTTSPAGTVSGLVTGAGTLSAIGHSQYTYPEGTETVTAVVAADLDVANVVLSDETTLLAKPDGTPTQIGNGTSVNVNGNVTIAGAVNLVNAGTINVTDGYHSFDGSSYGSGISAACNSGSSILNSGTIILSGPGSANVGVCGNSFTNSGTISNTGVGTNGVYGSPFNDTGSITSSTGVLTIGSTGTFSGGTITGGGGQVVITGVMTATPDVTFGDNVWVTGNPQNGGAILSGTTTIAANSTLHVGYDPSFGESTIIGDTDPTGTIDGVVTGAGTLSAIGHSQYTYPEGTETVTAVIAADLYVANTTIDSLTSLAVKPDTTPSAIGTGTTVTILTSPSIASNFVLNNYGVINYGTTGFFSCPTCTFVNETTGILELFNPDGSFLHAFYVNTGNFDNEGLFQLTGYMPGTLLTFGPNVNLEGAKQGKAETMGLIQPTVISNLQSGADTPAIAQALAQAGGLNNLVDNAMMYVAASDSNLGLGKCTNINGSIPGIVVPAGASVGVCLVIDPNGNEAVVLSFSTTVAQVKYPPSGVWQLGGLQLKDSPVTIDTGVEAFWNYDPDGSTQAFNAISDSDGLSYCENGELSFGVGLTGQHCWGPSDGVPYDLGTLTTFRPGTHSGYLGVDVLGVGASAGGVLSYSVTLSCSTFYTQTQYTCPPTNKVLPAISGTPSVGTTIHASLGTWTMDSSNNPLTYNINWERCTSSSLNSCGLISGASSTSYTVQTSDENDWLTVVVIATNAGGSTAARANPVGSVPVPSP